MPTTRTTETPLSLELEAIASAPAWSADRSSRGWAYIAFTAAGKRLQDADQLVPIEGPDACVQSVMAAAVGWTPQRTHRPTRRRPGA
jgi:hypothetical protein